MNKILITGSTGFIGKHLTENLLSNKDKIYALIRESKKNYLHSSKIKKKYKNFFPIFFNKNEELAKKITNLKPKIFINLATKYMTFPNIKEMPSVINSNLEFPSLILKILNDKSKIKFINICSIMQCDNNQIDNPLNFYALTKILFKKTLKYYQKFYPKNIFINLYIGDTYGKSDTRNKILPIIIKNFKKNKKTTIVTKKLNLDILHVQDVINGIKILIKSVKNSNDFYIKPQKKINLYKIIHTYNLNNTKKIKILWQNKINNTILNIKLKSVPAWKQKFDVVKMFYKDLNENH